MDVLLHPRFLALPEPRILVLFTRSSPVFSSAMAAGLPQKEKKRSAAKTRGHRQEGVGKAGVEPSLSESLKERSVGVASSRLQPAVSEQPDLRVLHSRIAARSGFHAPGFYSPSGTALLSLPENRARIVDAAGRLAYREAGETLYEIVAGSDVTARSRKRMRFSMAFRVQDVPPDVFAKPEPSTVLVQQSIRRLPALPGLWRHDRF